MVSSSELGLVRQRGLLVFSRVIQVENPGQLPTPL